MSMIKCVVIDGVTFIGEYEEAELITTFEHVAVVQIIEGEEGPQFAVGSPSPYMRQNESVPLTESAIDRALVIFPPQDQVFEVYARYRAKLRELQEKSESPVDPTEEAGDPA